MILDYKKNHVVAFSMLPTYVSVAILIIVLHLNAVLSVILYIFALYLSDLIYNQAVLSQKSTKGKIKSAYWAFTISQWLVWGGVVLINYYYFDLTNIFGNNLTR